jgi:hypothetical protein
MPRSKQSVPLGAARHRLALIWFPSCALIFLILIAQSVGGAYGERAQIAWGWALPNFMPSLALMMSAYAADALKPPDGDEPSVRRAFLTLAIALSVFYLLLVVLSILLQPVFGAAGGDGDPASDRLELLDLSNLWLAPLQALVVGALGVLFFVKDGETEKKETTS